MEHADDERATHRTVSEYLQREKGVSEAQALLGDTDNLCFNVDRFVAEQFHVDRFVAECKDRVSLHTLREDLETHYKNIRVALIDLINEDYADFVNLSSNLVGMEKSIEHLRQPLGQLREEIGVSRKGLNDELELIESKLRCRRDVREKKTKLQHLINVVNSVEKIEKILFGKQGSTEIEMFMEGGRESIGQFLERVAGEFNQLQFHVNQSKGHPIIHNIKSRVSLITSKLQESLEKTFENGLAAQQSDLVLRCLRTYALIDKTGHAEDLFRHNFVKPKIESLINEESHNRRGLKNICNDVLAFIQSDCQMLFKLTTETNHGSSKNEKEDIVKGFDFLVNAVWPEVDDAFEKKLSFIFSPGNPDLFYERYNTMMEFLENFEECCTSLESFKRLRAHSSYQAFMAKWSLPVYFQIRLQEIGGQVEAAIDTPLHEAKEDATLFKTNLVSTVWRALNRCWDENVFLKPIFSRFWKLFLQILSRLVIEVKRILEELSSNKDEEASSDEKEGSEQNTPSKHDMTSLGKFLGDIYKLNSEVSSMFKSKVEPLLKIICDSSYQQHIAAFNETIEDLASHSEALSKYFVKVLSDEGSIQFENTKNIPRLYRRTNRDPPSQASPYITHAFAPLRNFTDAVSESLASEKVKNILKESAFIMTLRYFIIVDELVASIKKTEESLQRLKRLRKGPESNTQASSSNEMSDESKIRKQLFLDVEQFGKEASSLTDFEMENHDEYKQLLELVINANKGNS